MRLLSVLHQDAVCHDVASTFDFNLEWRQPLHATNPNALPGGYALGACVGHSVSGKSTALARLCDDSLPEAFSWDNEVPVKLQIGSTEYCSSNLNKEHCVPNQAMQTNQERVHKWRNVQSDISLSAMHSYKSTDCKCTFVHWT